MEYFSESKVFRWTQEEVVRVRNGQGWFQLKLKEEYLKHFKVGFLPHLATQKLSHFKFI